MHKNNPKINRVLFDCERMKYPNTGLYHFCLQLGQALLRNMDASKEKISFYLPGKSGKPFGDQASYISQHGFHKLIFPSVKMVDIWHSTHQESDYKPPLKKWKEVLTIHDLNFLYEHKNRPEKIKRSLRNLQTQINRADKICTISEYVKTDLQQHLQLSGKEVEVIYNGCNIQYSGQALQPQTLPGKPFIFSLGTITAKKNFHVLPALLRKNDLQLIIAGIVQQEAYKNKIIAEAKKHGVENRLVFTGAISENDKQWHLQNCAAFAFPSIAEGFGLPVIEAMAFGKPIFLSKATSLPEIGGDVSYYFNSFDPEDMQSVFSKGMEHYHSQNPQEAIRNRAAFFNWNNAAKQYIEIYNNLY